MRSRIVISALVFIALCALKILFPEEALRLRDALIPAVNREASLREDCMAIGRAISGEEGYLTVWRRLIGEEKNEQASLALPSPSPKKAAATGQFVLSEMVSGYLSGYETVVGPPSPSVSPSASPSVSPVPTDTPTPTAAPTSTPVPAVPVSAVSLPAPDTLPVDVSLAPAGQSAKIEAFLAEQSAFSDYAVPANVSYDAPVLPFSYAKPCAAAITSGFGYRDHPLDSVVKFHYGTDLGAYDGDTITAFADGKVLSVQELDGYGLTVLIEHAGGFSTLYAHSSQILVKQGDSVKCGDKIALVGHTGNVTGPHLHFEIIYNGKYLNPAFYLG